MRVDPRGTVGGDSMKEWVEWFCDKELERRCGDVVGLSDGIHIERVVDLHT